MVLTAGAAQLHGRLRGVPCRLLARVACLWALQVVEFSHVGGAESADTAEIRVPVGATVVVRLQSVGGYRPVLVSAQSGAVGLSELSQASPSSAEDVKHLIEQGPSIPEGLQVQLPTPFTRKPGSLPFFSLFLASF